MDFPVVGLFTLLLVIVSIYFYGEHFLNEVEYVRSRVDNQYYLVRNLPDKQESCDLLARVNIRIKKFLKYLRKKHYNDSNILRLFRNYNEHQISESLPNSQFTSYSVNKGEKIIFCIRQREKNNDRLMDINTMMFVAIHELSHLMSLSIGHTEEFWSNMKFLLKEAIRCPEKIYRYVPYHTHPQKYCGTVITDTPYKQR
jgi:predicted metal-dependent hydrolase